MKSPDDTPSTSRTRRTFIRQASFTAAAAALSLYGSGAPAREGEGEGEGPVLRAAGYRMPRFEALFNGGVTLPGFDVRFEEVGIGDANTNTFSGAQTWDFTEIGLHPFMLAYANEGFRDYTLLPVFPLRLFRHKSIFIRADTGIKSPQDLRGRAVGTPGYSSTSLTWIRGMLKDEYGVAPTDIDWVLSNKDSSADVAGKVSAQESMIPDGLSVRYGPAGADESELLLSGEVDALFHAATPQAFVDGDPRVTRLFENSRQAELAYYQKTGIFPIMHALAVRRSVLEENPGLAKAIFDAYSQAKSRAYARMAKLGWATDMLPWYGQELEHTVAAMGPNFYSYGIAPNRKTLEALFRYSYDQGLAKKRLTIEELFYKDALAFEE